MKLAFLNIERFGARSNLQLDDLSQQLNVVYGPNGSGKTTIINFIRWVLYGSQDQGSRRYLSSATAQAGGSLRVIDGEHQVRVVTRHDDGTAGGRVSISRATGELFEYDQMRLTGVDLHEYAHIFSFGFDQPPAIDETVSIAVSRGFELTYDPRQLRRLQELDQQLSELLRTYHGMPESEDGLPLLRQRREEIQKEIEVVERRRLERLRELDVEASQLKQNLARRRAQLTEIEAGLRRAEEKMTTRRRQLEEAAQEALRLREQSTEAGRREVAEIDEQIQQWHNVLQAIRERLESLQARMAEWKPQARSASVRDEAELRLCLRTLGYRMDDIEQDVHDLALPDELEDHGAAADYLRSVLGAALHTMRDDVQQLSGEVQRQKSTARYHDHAREQQNLRRCESELTDLIHELGQRREQLLSSELHPSWETTRWTQDVSTDSDYKGDSVIRPWYENRTAGPNGSGSTTAHRYVADFVLEARLNHLIKRRDYLALRVRDLQADMTTLERRLEMLLASREQIDEQRKLDVLRRDLAGMDERMRRAEARQELRDRIESLQREISQSKATLDPSEIIRDASVTLQRMTGGAYRQVRINDAHEIWIDDAESTTHRFSELSRGTRDQVYLSLSLALVAAYYQRGVELPLILNDVFVNIDSGRAQATAEVLEEFAGRGHQTILFTRHEHVLQLFPNSRGRRFKLQQRGRSVPTPQRRDAVYLDRVPTPTEPSYPLPPSIARADRAYDWVAQRDTARRPRIEYPVVESVGSNERTVTEDTPLIQVDGLDPELVARLNEIEIQNVRAFLPLDPEQGEELLAGYGITAPLIHRWQAVVTLQCYVGLTASDANLLVICGIDDPQELSYIDVSELHRRIEHCLANHEHRDRFGSISRYERSRLARWIQAARQSRFRRNRPPRSIPQRMAPPPVVPRPEPKRSPRTRAMVQAESAVPEEIAVPEDREVPLRFFLEPTDPVVDAPSIGPKTAERLHAVGVNSVADLLEKDPEEVAEQINYRRITPKLIHEWQMQTQLVCRVPNLRGHDAQILVACGVTTPRQLASMIPDELSDKVKRFIRTTDGKRIMRNGKKPDLAEVTAWIQWAENARELQLT